MNKNASLVVRTLLVVGVFNLTSCTRHVDESDLSINIFVEKPASFDKGFESSPNYFSTAPLLFEKLYKYDTSSTSFQIVGELAQDLPAVSKDGTTYTVKIKSDRVYKPACQTQTKSITSRDVINSLKTHPTIARLFHPEFTEVDASSLEIKLPKADPRFLTALAQSTYIAVEDSSCQKPSVFGSGPFEVLKQEEKHTVFSKKNSPKEEIHFRWIADPNSQWINLTKGNADVAYFPDERREGILFGKDLPKHLKVHRHFSDTILALSLNMSDPLLGKNKTLRQAISLAIDSLEFSKVAYKGEAVPVDSFVLKGFWGYQESVKNTYRIPNLEQAKALLKKAGFIDGKGLAELKIEIGSSPLEKERAQVIVDQLARAQIAAQISKNSPEELREKIKNQTAQLFFVEYEPSLKHGLSSLSPFYLNEQDSLLTTYKNTPFSKLFEMTLLLTSSSMRLANFNQMRDQVFQDVPLVYLVQLPKYIIYADWVKNIPDLSSPEDFIKNIKIDFEQRAKTKKAL